MAQDDREDGAERMVAAARPRRDLASRARLRERVRSEFSEMPGLSLTVEQAGRLLSLDSGVCGRVLRELVLDGFLRQEADGSYGRHDRGA